MNTILTILISTLEEGILGLEKAVCIQHPLIQYLIVHQTRSASALPSNLIQRSDITVVRSPTRGIAASRNIGLKHCQTPYALIADDDVEFLPEGIAKLLDLIASKKPDFALFKIKTPAGQPEYKPYPRDSYPVDRLKHWVSSIELVVNADKVKKEKLFFDERFGLGTKLGSGEEEIFVTDMIKSGWRGFYFPIYIVIHPFESSGKRERGHKELYFFQGAYDRRIGKSRRRTDSLFQYIRRPSLVIGEFFYHRGKKYIQKKQTQIPRYLKAGGDTNKTNVNSKNF